MSQNGYELGGLPLPEHLPELVADIPPGNASGRLRAFVDRGVERAVWDNGCYFEVLTWKSERTEWTEDHPPGWDQSSEAIGDNPVGWDDGAMALYKRACDSIRNTID